MEKRENKAAPKDTIPSYKPPCILHVMFLFSFVKIWLF